MEPPPVYEESVFTIENQRANPVRMAPLNDKTVDPVKNGGHQFSRGVCCVIVVIAVIIASSTASGLGVFYLTQQTAEQPARQPGGQPIIICPYVEGNTTSSISFNGPIVKQFDNVNHVSITYSLETGEVIGIFPASVSPHTLHSLDDKLTIITATASDGSKSTECSFTYVHIPAWTNWGSWSSCTKECGTGQHSRTRTCRLNNLETNGCIGDSSDTDICNSHECPNIDCPTEQPAGQPGGQPIIICPYVEGNTTSSISFNGPIVKQFDNIDHVSITYSLETGEVIGIFPASVSPHALHSLDDKLTIITATASDGSKSTECSFTYVHIPAWTNWGSWSSCTKECGTGQHSRTRTCRLNNLETNGCIGDSSDTDICNSHECPNIDCPTASPSQDLPRDCTEVKDRGNSESGQYMISPQDDGSSFRVYCDMETDGGGWTVFQRREDGSVNFYLNWDDYESGFGHINSEHWLGNERINRITAQGNYEIRIDMSDFDGNSRYAKYDNFRLGNAVTNYKLILGSYSGDAGDSLSEHANQAFSTKDRDHDTNVGTNCANVYKGGWWYTACHYSNLNGLYLGGTHASYANGVNWRAWRGYYYSLKYVEMKIRRTPS